MSIRRSNTSFHERLHRFQRSGRIGTIKFVCQFQQCCNRSVQRRQVFELPLSSIQPLFLQRRIFWILFAPKAGHMLLNQRNLCIQFRKVVVFATADSHRTQQLRQRSGRNSITNKQSVRKHFDQQRLRKICLQPPQPGTHRADGRVIVTGNPSANVTGKGVLPSSHKHDTSWISGT